ncbi:hypothetical protein C8Q76DRAFT_792151 [Earliella scabrosa]|nr:hypothetical protein C8Q76DRAFT_792151 [Earliella scabrosa]
MSAPNSALDNFFSVWPIDSIIVICTLSMSVFLAVEAYRVRIWNPVQVLYPFFPNIPHFLSTLDACDGIVSGLQALQLLHRTRYPAADSDLNIFLPCHGLLRMGRWIKRHGYTYQPSGRKHVFFDVDTFRLASGIANLKNRRIGASGTSTAVEDAPAFAVYHFIRTLLPKKDGAPALTTRVQLVVTRDNPVEYVINNFRLTGNMNYFTGKYAVSLFPRSTFIDEVVYACHDLNPDGRQWISKYRQRGFEVVVAGGVPSVEEPGEIGDVERTVGDSYTWIVPFTSSAMDFSTLPTYDLVKVKFDVLPVSSGVAPRGAYLRIGPRFLYSAMSLVTTRRDVTGSYWSAELETVLL